MWTTSSKNSTSRRSQFFGNAELIVHFWKPTDILPSNLWQKLQFPSGRFAPARRNLRIPRPERRGKDDHDSHAARPPAPQPGATAVAICGFLAFAMFVLDYVGRFWQAIGGVSMLSPFHYYSPFPLKSSMSPCSRESSSPDQSLRWWPARGGICRMSGGE